MSHGPFADVGGLRRQVLDPVLDFGGRFGSGEGRSGLFRHRRCRSLRDQCLRRGTDFRVELTQHVLSFGQRIVGREGQREFLAGLLFLVGLIQQIPDVIVRDGLVVDLLDRRVSFVHAAHGHQHGGEVVVIQLAIGFQLTGFPQGGERFFTAIMACQAETEIVVGHGVFRFGFDSLAIELLGFVEFVPPVMQACEADEGWNVRRLFLESPLVMLDRQGHVAVGLGDTAGLIVQIDVDLRGHVIQGERIGRFGDLRLDGECVADRVGSVLERAADFLGCRLRRLRAVDIAPIRFDLFDQLVIAMIVHRRGGPRLGGRTIGRQTLARLIGLTAGHNERTGNQTNDEKMLYVHPAPP